MSVVARCSNRRPARGAAGLRGVIVIRSAPGRGHEFVVDALDLAHAPGHVEEGPPRERAARQPMSERGVPDQHGDGIGQGVGLLGRDQQRVEAIGPEIRDFAHGSGHDRHAHGRRLHEGHGEPFVARGQDEEIRCAEQAQNVRPRAHESEAITQPQAGVLDLELLPAAAPGLRRRSARAVRAG